MNKDQEKYSKGYDRIFVKNKKTKVRFKTKENKRVEFKAIKTYEEIGYN